MLRAWFKQLRVRTHTNQEVPDFEQDVFKRFFIRFEIFMNVENSFYIHDMIFETAGTTKTYTPEICSKRWNVVLLDNFKNQRLWGIGEKARRFPEKISLH